MKGKTKGFIAGFLLCALIVGAVIPASAAVYDKLMEVYYRDIKVTIDGQTVTPKDAQGRPIEPFLSGGTTYLPIRGIASALGLDVAWDQSPSTVSLSTGEQPVDFWGQFMAKTDGHVLTKSEKFVEFGEEGEYTWDAVFLSDYTFYVYCEVQDRYAYKGEYSFEGEYLNLRYSDPMDKQTGDAGHSDIYKTELLSDGFSLELVRTDNANGTGALADEGEKAAYKINETKKQYDVHRMVESVFSEYGETY